MDEIVALADWSLWAFAALFVIAHVIFFEGGFRLGVRQRSRASIQADSVGLVAGALLGLLAFVLALTLSFATSRFSERRAGTLAEANAIGTTWLRAEAIAHPSGRDIARLLERYAQVRLDFIHANRDPAKLDALSRETNQLQLQIWGNMAVIAREEPNLVSASLMSAINETFDTSTAERFGYVQRLPPQVFRLITYLPGRAGRQRRARQHRKRLRGSAGQREAAGKLPVAVVHGLLDHRHRCRLSLGGRRIAEPALSIGPVANADAVGR